MYFLPHSVCLNSTFYTKAQALLWCRRLQEEVNTSYPSTLYSAPQHFIFIYISIQIISTQATAYTYMLWNPSVCSLYGGGDFSWLASRKQTLFYSNFHKAVYKLELLLFLYTIPLHQQFQPFSSHGTHKLITKILQHTKKYTFYNLSKK